MFREVDPQVSFVELEHDVLRFWEEDGTFGRLRAQNASGPIWSFLDGPITANNPMGVHHAWGRTYKDCYQRFHAMKGHRLRYQNGFDCQGLWVEVEVEKELGFETKRDIETFGIGNFVERCKQRASRFAAIQSEQSVRLGYWMDWSDSYYTMSDENNYTIWAFLKKCHNEGLIYRGRDSMPWCPRCGTGISQHEMHESYKEVTEDSVIVALPLRERPGERLLVWTTTPWTLPANVACAVHPELEYVAVKRDGDLCWLSAGSVGPLKLASQVVDGKRLKGADLVGLTYDGPFDELDAQSETRLQHRVIAWEMVSDAEGTGIVTSRRAAAARTSSYRVNWASPCWRPSTSRASTSPATASSPAALHARWCPRCSSRSRARGSSSASSRTRTTTRTAGAARRPSSSATWRSGSST